MPRNAPTSIVQSFSGMKQEYAGMNESRFRRRRPGVTSVGAGADYHVWNEAAFNRMREYVRAMDRDDFLIGPLTDRAIENQHQGGFVLEVETGDKGLDEELAADWAAWTSDATQCDAEGTRDFCELERLVGRSEYVDGDIFALPTEDGALQLVEAHRCRTPSNSKKNIVHGVELDEQRRRVRYFFTKEDLSAMTPLRLVSDTKQYAAFDEEGNRQVFHVLKPARISQTRGVTRFKAVVDIATMVEDTNFATLVKQQMAACLAWSWEQTPGGAYGGDQRHGERAETEWADFTRKIEEGVSPGQMFRPPPGMKLNVHTPAIPSAEYHAHIKMLITFISVQLGMPLFLALLDASDTNFSSWRGAWDQTKLTFRTEQRRRAGQFHREVYRWRVRRKLADDPAMQKVARKRKVDVFGHRWNFPNWPYIQPLHDAQANAIRLTTGQISLPKLHAEIGSDFETFAQENVKANEFWMAQAIDAAERLKAKYGDKAKDVHWAHLYHRDYPRGAQLIDTIEDPNDGSGGAKATPAKK